MVTFGWAPSKASPASDGVRFQSFLNTPSGLRYGTRIDPLAVDAKGRLWLAPDQVGLIYLENGAFHEVLTNEEALTVRVENICADGTNGIVGRREWALGVFQSGQKGLETLKPRAGPGSRWFEDTDGKMWLLAPRRLRLYEGRHWRDIALPGTANFAATPCRARGVWVARDAKLRLASESGEVREIALFPWHGVSRVQCMVEDSKKRLWIGTVGQGVVLL